MSTEMNMWIFDTMISMTLLMAVVLLLRKPVRHYFGAKIAYALWALPVARLFMPVLTLEAPAPVATPVESVAASPAAMQAMNGIAMSAQVQQASTSALASIDWFLVAMIVWFGGAGMLFISKLASYVQFREDIVSDGQLVGRHGNIKILETAAVGGPLAFGIFQKYIAVPTDFFRNYSPRERELALEHEIAHHESGDLAANFAGLLILSLHWFNPVAWVAWVAFREDQETACDARILQQSGQEVRAIYGRTIAKSASGHQLGLASPLNQKDKIKGRLKMLGQRQKSGFRKSLGMLMVGASTVVALPLTATVVYAEADVAEAAHPEDHDSADTHVKKEVRVTVDENGEKKKTVKIRKSKGKGGKDPLAGIDMEPRDGEYVRKIERDGKTIVLRTTKPLTDAEVEKMIKEAEESRREAEADLRDHERDMKDHERDMKEHKREMRIEMREVEREIEEARREVEREMREVQREVERSVREANREAREAAREARISSRISQRQSQKVNRKTSRVWSIANQVAEISFAPRAPRTPQVAPVIRVPAAPAPDCMAMNKKIAFAGQKGLANASWAVVAGCGDFQVNIDEKKLMKLTLKNMERDFKEAKQCRDRSKAHQNKLRAYDRDIKKLKAQLSMT